MKVLEDALVAELSPAECGGLVASRTGLLLQRLDGHAPAEADPTSADPYQVASTNNLCISLFPLKCLICSSVCRIVLS